MECAVILDPPLIPDANVKAAAVGGMIIKQINITWELKVHHPPPTGRSTLPLKDSFYLSPDEIGTQKVAVLNARDSKLRELNEHGHPKDIVMTLQELQIGEKGKGGHLHIDNGEQLVKFFKDEKIE